MLNPIRGIAVWSVVCLSLLAGCGGGGGGSSGPGNGVGPDNGTATPGPAGPSSSFAQQCAANNMLATADLRNSTLDSEKRWLRSYFDEAYLWRDQVPTVDPGLAAYNGSDTYTALSNYFEALKSPAVTDSGASRDRFSFTLPTAQWKALSEEAVSAGYGIEWRLASPTPPRNIRIAYIEPGSPAEMAGLMRGDTMVTVDGIDADAPDAAGVNVLNAGLFPDSLGSTHRFIFQRGATTLSLDLTSSSIAANPVPQSRVLTMPGGARAGYIVFNDHVLPAEGLLIKAVNDLRGQNVSELVLDLRYNGGGYLFIASELATMIAGTTRTAGRAFETLHYNARRSAENEVTPFYNQSCVVVDGRCSSQQPLPTLNLNRVYVLAQADTCSASEALINGLRGIDVEVVLIGGTTCGKPYGFTAKDNCGISYFPIEFAGVNDKGFGDYADGFEPGTGPTQRFVPGCSVADDLDRALGDPQEAMLAAALKHATTGQCPAQTSSAVAKTGMRSNAAPLLFKRNPARNSRLILSP